MPNPLRIALLNDHELVAHGVRSMLASNSERFRFVELNSIADLVGPVDVTLYDAFAHGEDGLAELDSVIADDRTGAVAIYTWTMHQSRSTQALEHGCRGFLDKAASSEQLVAWLLALAAGHVVVADTVQDDQVARNAGHLTTWPGSGVGLTARESEVLSLITQGLTNQDIAAHSYLSINSVKSYIRSAYRKIGVERRSQAVRWGLENGMAQNTASPLAAVV